MVYFCHIWVILRDLVWHHDKSEGPMTGHNTPVMLPSLMFSIYVAYAEFSTHAFKADVMEGVVTVATS